MVRVETAHTTEIRQVDLGSEDDDEVRMTMERWKQKRHCGVMMAIQVQEEKEAIQLCVSEVDSKQ